jgi:hypothetical protein
MNSNFTDSKVEGSKLVRRGTVLAYNARCFNAGGKLLRSKGNLTSHSSLNINVFKEGDNKPLSKRFRCFVRSLYVEIF